MPEATASGTADGASARNREHNQGNQERKYTVEQKRAVLRIRRCEPTAFYEILEIQKTCTDAEVKKAYRKQSLLTHPDKNGHENADEAFKMVSRAFSVLADKEKRDKFDRFGTDPDSRFESARQQQQQQQGNPFAGFASRGAGGGMGRGGFGDNGPQFVFNFGGGPGVRVHQFGGARPRTRPRNPGQQEEETSMFSTVMGLLPIILLFIFPLLSSIFSGITSEPAIPNMSFEAPDGPYTVPRAMPVSGVKYFLTPEDARSLTANKAYTLDKQAENLYRQGLSVACENQRAHQQRLAEAAQGWFYQDPQKMEVARSYKTPACEKLTSLRLGR
ncbi:DnaJ domain-containing protein [Bombardia bombarda]|uniref:DnaJ domain-containing protein n=1 Tax=Bombardia bombarda TaxID=252184 RepID=A0AA40CD97_9PEZI|nr:DnaJ domain-containing protein [Bombardia bombarda]